MSHFPIIVETKTNERDELEAALQPFHEYECTGTKDQYVVEVDVTDEAESTLDDEIEIVRMPDGTIHNKYDQMFYQTNSSDPFSSSKFVLPVGATLDKMVRREMLAVTGRSVEEFAESYGGWIHRDGKFFNFTNPNAKWDWWEVGGRWAGYFAAKNPSDAVLGNRSWYNANTEIAGNRVDSLQKGNIDFEAMWAKEEENARAYHSKCSAATYGCPRAIEWNAVREQMFPDDIDKARQFYGSQPMIVALRAARLDSWTDELNDYFPEDVEVLVRRKRAEAIVPYSFVTLDGRWHQKGKMGWFRMSDDQMTQDEWNEYVNKLIDAIPDDHFLTAVDCHI